MKKKEAPKSVENVVHPPEHFTNRIFQSTLDELFEAIQKHNERVHGETLTIGEVKAVAKQLVEARE